MALFRRRKETLHEQLLREAGLQTYQTDAEPATPAAEEPRPPNPFELWRSRLDAESRAMHARPAEYDALVFTEAPVERGNRPEFVTLPDGTILVESEEGDAELAPLAEAVERELSPPYRASASRQTDRLWAVTVDRIEVAELRGDGDEIELTYVGGTKTFTVDGKREFGSVPELERLGQSQGPEYAVRATRLEGDFWEVQAHAL